jgi:hypothetical protein
VLKLKKALYGLHQVPRAWNAKLDDTLLSLGFRRTPSEHVIYVRRNGNMQLGDILTKPLGRVKFLELRTKIGLIDVNRHNKA